MPLQVADAFVRLVVDERELQKAVSAQNGPAGRAGAQVGQTVGSRFSGAFAASTTVAGAAAGAIFAGAIGGAVNFEDQLRTINTVAKLTDGELSAVGKSILDLSKETGKSTDDLTAGFYDLVSAGVPASKAIDVLRASAKFATGALGTTGEAVDVVTSAMNAYGLQAEDATKITDIFAQAVQDGKVTAAELGASIANIAPIAASAGISLEEVSAGFASLTAKGVPAAQAATQMRAAISALLTPNTQLNAIQEQTGINFAKLAEAKGLAVALEELRKATGGNADAFAKALGSIEAYQFALGTTGENADAFAGELEKVEKASVEGGVAQAQYEERMKSAKAQGDKLLASIHALAIEIGGPFTSVLGPAIGLLSQLGTTALFLTSTGIGGGLGRIFGGAWTKLAASGPLRAIITRAGAAAATAYLSALIVGDSIGAALSGAWSKIVGSSAVRGATGAAGRFLGSTLGKFAAVAFAAVLVFEAIETYNRIKAELGAQANDIGNHVGEQIATGSVDSLEQSRGALQAAIDDLANVRDFGIFTNEARANLQRDLDKVNAEIADRLRKGAPGYAAAGADVADRVADGFGSKTATLAGAMTLTIKGAFGSDLAARSSYARAVGYRLAGATADGIHEGIELADQAWTALIDAIKNVQTPAQRAARLIGRLSSKELAKGLNDGRPEVRLRAEAVYQATIDELNQIVDGGGKVGRKGMTALVAAMKLKNPVIAAAAREVYNKIKHPLDGLPGVGTKTGKGTTTNLTTQLNRGKGPVGTAAKGLATTIATNILRGVLAGTAGYSRPGQAPVAYALGTNYVPRDMVAMIHQGEIIIPARQSEAVRSGEAAIVGGSVAPQASGGDNYYQLTVAGLVEARDPMEIAREMRRVASFKPTLDRTRPRVTAGVGGRF